MSRNNIRVNILNVGKIFGIQTPAYNVPMDIGTYQLLLEMGVNVEIYHPKENATPIPVEKHSADPVSIQAVKKYDTTAVKEKRPRKVVLPMGDFVAKDIYEEKELLDLSKPELVRILNYRGHYSSRTGRRDSLAPKYDDTKTILINKILLTNNK